ncbi:MAG: YqaA family protein, partial [Nitrospirota bacterium]|nr:YqaA family protein [Nitrospirota bacterium]
MVKELYQWMLSWSDSEYAIPALFLLAFAESAFFPLPPDVLVMALTLGNPSWGMYYAAVSTVGSVLGGMFGYAIGWYGGRPILLKFMGQERVAAIHATFQKYEGWAILIAGFTPIPYKVFTVGAGAFYVNFKVFVVASLISRGARFFLVAGTMQLFGPWVQELIEQYFNLFSILFVVLCALGIWIVKLLAKKKVDSREL